ncbi:hypothetical protein LUZ60_008916 [Juncus effusus]|nr:hypothetical protein LUZ60_008916 [Juncus effusus]
MANVIMRFFISSIFMWILPLAILYAFAYGIIPGVSQLSPQNKTLLSGFLAVISVNLVIGYYICMAMKENPTRSDPQPDPKFLAEAKASINQSETASSSSSGIDQVKGNNVDHVKGKTE